MTNPKLFRTCCQARWRPANLNRKRLNIKSSSSSLNATWFSRSILTAVWLQHTTEGFIASVVCLLLISLDLYFRICRVIPKFGYTSPVLCTNRLRWMKALSMVRYNKLNVVNDLEHSCDGSTRPVLTNVIATGKAVSKMFWWIKTTISFAEGTNETGSTK